MVVRMTSPLFRVDHGDEHDRGLAHDLTRLIELRRTRPFDRRHALRLLGGTGLVALAACGSDSVTTATTAPSPTTAATVGTAAPGPGGGPPPGGGGAASGGQPTDGTIPQETAGPYPGDGSNGPNALSQSGVVRKDMTTSIGSSTKVPGVPLTMTLKLTKGVGGAALAGAAVYLWHCDQNGLYSMYSQGVTNETWLRAVQEANPSGEVTFTTIYPGCYDGRWPHMHFEVYPTLASATSSGSKISTSQVALTEATAKLVYATSGYATSVSNLSRITIATDNVFSDGVDRQTPTITGDVTKGFTATMTIPVAV